jgi:hypothetical protein
MTWVIGMAGNLSGGVLAADVRVSFSNGDERDVIRKLHEVAPNIVVGFSGSVRVGFEMVEQLRMYSEAVFGDEYVPAGKFVFESRGAARKVWRSAASAEQDLGCSLMLVGAQPPKGFVHSNAGFVLRAPDFDPVQFGRTPVAIGSGSGVADYKGLLQESTESWIERFKRFNLINMAPLEPFGSILGDTIDASPQPGISPHLHLCQVRCGDIRWYTNDRVAQDGVTWTMPDVADDYASFLYRCGASDVAADEALA